MEEEIDLRPYLAALIRQWRTIGVVVVVATIGAAILAISLPQSFTASADVLILPSRSQLTFDSRFVTSNASLGTDAASRRQALLALATSTALETKVLPELPVNLVGKEYRPGSLARRLQITSEGDLLHIEANAQDEQSAQVLASAWGQAYVGMINDLYGRDEAMLHEIESQLSNAQNRYEQAQSNVETFIGSGTFVRVEQQISMTTELLTESRDSPQKLYVQYLEQARALEATLRDAETLRQQVAEGQTDGLANGLTMLALRVRAAGDVQLPIDLRFDDPSAFVNSSASLADLDALIGVLQQRIAALMEHSGELAQAIGDEDENDNAGGISSAQRESYENRLGKLRQQFEQQTAQLKFLQQRRDLALDSLSILQRKLEEQRVALGTPEIQVRFIGVAVEPPRSALSRIILFAGAAAVAGFFLSIFIILSQAIIRPWLPSHRPQPHSERPLDQPTIG
jgi:uncharacterized protein involved in exopolysaccharide biosynthesis